MAHRDAEDDPIPPIPGAAPVSAVEDWRRLYEARLERAEAAEARAEITSALSSSVAKGFPWAANPACLLRTLHDAGNAGGRRRFAYGNRSHDGTGAAADHRLRERRTSHLLRCARNLRHHLAAESPALPCPLRRVRRCGEQGLAGPPRGVDGSHAGESVPGQLFPHITVRSSSAGPLAMRPTGVSRKSSRPSRTRIS